MIFGTICFVLHAQVGQFCLKLGFGGIFTAKARTQNKANETPKTKNKTKFSNAVLAPVFLYTLLAVPSWGPWDARRQ